MKTVFGIIGAAIGAVFGLIAAAAIVRLLNHGNVLGEGFMLLIAAPAGILTGLVAGAAIAVRVASFLREPKNSETARRRKRLVLLGILLSLPGAFAAVGWGARELARPPADSAMLRNFDRHKQALDSLVEMAHADTGLTRVDEDWTMPADTPSVGVSTERLLSYRKLLREAGTRRGFKKKDGELDFYYWLRGSAISDDAEKGYAYRTRPPLTIDSTLDGQVAHRDSVLAYRHISGNWYLFYEFVPD